MRVGELGCSKEFEIKKGDCTASLKVITDYLSFTHCANFLRFAYALKNFDGTGVPGSS